jgi:hypothetical protein
MLPDRLPRQMKSQNLGEVKMAIHLHPQTTIFQQKVKEIAEQE